jgi:hypothetical protein
MEALAMKYSTLKVTALALPVLFVATYSRAQEPRDEAKPPQQEEPKAEPKHETPPRQNEMKPPHQDEAKPPKDERSEEKKEEKQETAKPPRDNARPAQEQRGEQAERHERPAGKSTRIPDEKFRASFGREHTVVIRQPVLVEGRPRFQFAGYWFDIVDAWPGDWSYSDDCYVDYIDGEYFLFNVRHPGVRIALFVTAG